MLLCTRLNRSPRSIALGCLHGPALVAFGDQKRETGMDVGLGLGSQDRPPGKGQVRLVRA